METITLTKLTNIHNFLQHALDNEKNVKEKLINVFNDISKEDTANDKYRRKLKICQIHLSTWA